MFKDGCDIDGNELSVGDLVTYLPWTETWVIYKNCYLQERVGEVFTVGSFTNDSKDYLTLLDTDGNKVWGHWCLLSFRKVFQ